MGLFRKKPQPIWFVLKPASSYSMDRQPMREGPYTRATIVRLYAERQLPADVLLWTNERIFPNAERPNSSRRVRLMEWRRMDQLPDPVVRQLEAEAFMLKHPPQPHQSLQTASPQHSADSTSSSHSDVAPSSPPPPPPPNSFVPAHQSPSEATSDYAPYSAAPQPYLQQQQPAVYPQQQPPTNAPPPAPYSQQFVPHTNPQRQEPYASSPAGYPQQPAVYPHQPNPYPPPGYPSHAPAGTPPPPIH